jgi:hypothetical protein
MIRDKFEPSFNWIGEQGVDIEGLSKYFDGLYEKYQDVFDLHIVCEQAKITDARDFSNIRFNAMMKLVVMDALTDILGVDTETKTKLCRATVVPNWDLHLKKRPQDYPEGTPDILLRLGEQLDYDKNLVLAAGPDFFTTGRVDNDDVTMEEELMLLVSDLVDERIIGKPTIMSVDAHLNFKEIERADLGKEYWDRERTKDHQIMDKYFNGVPYDNVPRMILNHLAKKVA